MTSVDADLAWRAMGPADGDAWVDLMRAVEAVDGTGEHCGPDQFAEIVEDDNLDLATNSLVVFQGDRLVAYGVSWVRESVTDGEHLSYLEGAVHPELRRRGLGSEVVARLRVMSANGHRARFPEAKLVLAVRSHQRNEGQRALLAGLGFTPARYFFDMTASLDVEAQPVPEGLRLEPYSPEFAEATRLVSNEAFGDHWGSTPRSPQAWHHEYAASPTFLPELSWVLLDADGNVVAFLLATWFESDYEAKGVRELWMARIATLRPWRGRGAAGALLTHAMRAGKSAGYDAACLGVDAANPTGALGVYERAGFTVAERWESWTRPEPF